MSAVFRMSSPMLVGTPRHFVCATMAHSRQMDAVTQEGRSLLEQPERVALDAVAGASVVFDTMRTVRRVARTCEPQVGRWLELMASLPLSRVLVASKALGEQLSCTEERDKLSQWADDLGFTAENPHPVLDVLATGQPNQTQQRWLKKLTKLEDDIADSLGYGSSGVVMNGVYTSLSAATNCSKAYFCCDELRREEFVANGEACRVTVTSVGAHRVVGWLSSPCKVKTGDLMVLLGDASPGNIRLEAIGWDRTTQRLYGIFERPGSLVRGFKHVSSMRRGDEFVVTETPYVSVPRSGASPWAYASQTAPVTGREVPSDVLVAAGLA